MIKVLLVDDHALIRAAILNLLKTASDIDAIGEVSNGEDALNFARHNDIDVALVDITMPDMSGIELTRRLIQMKPKIKVIALTSHDDDLYIGQILKLGAAGYLTKDTNGVELIKAIHYTFYEDKRYVTPYVAEQIAGKYITGENNNPFNGLKPRELEILLLISRGYKAMEIAKKLFLSAKTINSYRYRLYKKLNIKSDVELTKLAIQYGLINLDEK